MNDDWWHLETLFNVWLDSCVQICSKRGKCNFLSLSQECDVLSRKLLQDLSIRNVKAQVLVQYKIHDSFRGSLTGSRPEISSNVITHSWNVAKGNWWTGCKQFDCLWSWLICKMIMLKNIWCTFTKLIFNILNSLILKPSWPWMILVFKYEFK